MRIFVTGTRGVPDIPGGVEKHCQELFPRIAAKGHEVIIATRRPYVLDPQKSWNGIRLAHLFCPKRKSLEAIIHTFLAVLAARRAKADLVHIHAVGPCLLVPFARILGLKVVVTNHGPDYDRQKWGGLAKAMLRLGEKWGGKYANEVIVISRVIADIIKKRCGRGSHLVYNGVPIPQKSTATDYLETKGIQPGKYLLAVARLVPEKGLHDLIAAFQQLPGDYQLVIAGDADHETEYSRQLIASAKEDPRIVMTGYVTGEALNQVFSHARLFVLPSYHEGLPIALLEAMSYGLSVLVSDIPANKEVDLPEKRYFRCGNVKDLAEKLHKLSGEVFSEVEQASMLNLLSDKYDWDKIAQNTLTVYQKAIP